MRVFCSHAFFVLLQYCTCFTANVTLLHQLNDEFDGVWISCGLRHRFRCGYDGFGFYNHSDIMTKMVWSQSGHVKRRLLYYRSFDNFVHKRNVSLSLVTGELYQTTVDVIANVACKLLHITKTKALRLFYSLT